jgi:hypothetical protein
MVDGEALRREVTGPVILRQPASGGDDNEVAVAVQIA